MKKRPLFLGTFGAIGLAVLLPSTVFAHGFADRDDLPVPLGLYMSAAGAVVVLSFVLIGIFAKRDFGVHYPKINLREWKVGRGLAHPVTVEVVRALSAFTFAVYLLAGLFGTEDPNENLVPTMTRIVFWVGIAYVSALIGNIWALINPWKIIFGYAESLMRKSSRRDLARYEPYPERLSAWPAVVFFLVFAWVEVVYTGSGVPLNIAALALVYSAITFVGMWWFGRDEWLRNGEVFTIVFGFLSAFAPVQITEPSGDDDKTAHGFSLGPWGGWLAHCTAPRFVEGSAARADAGNGELRWVRGDRNMDRAASEPAPRILVSGRLRFHRNHHYGVDPRAHRFLWRICANCMAHGLVGELVVE
jgi:hypothetical protein